MARPVQARRKSTCAHSLYSVLAFPVGESRNLKRGNKRGEVQTLQRTATHCNTRTFCLCGLRVLCIRLPKAQDNAGPHCNTLQHIATHCNTLQHTATHCNALQHAYILPVWTPCIVYSSPPRRTTTSARTATHCNTMQHTATHCNTLQHAYILPVWTPRIVYPSPPRRKATPDRLSRLLNFVHLFFSFLFSVSCTLQRTATHCNALQHTATHCNKLQHTARHCKTLQHTATHGNTRHTHCNTLQHTATHCNILQHTATCCNSRRHRTGRRGRLHNTIRSRLRTKSARSEQCLIVNGLLSLLHVALLESAYHVQTDR